MAEFRDPVAGAVQRYAMGLFGVQLGSTYMTQVKGQIAASNVVGVLGQVGDVFNAYYTLSFGGASNAAVANNILANLGVQVGKNGLTAANVDVAREFVLTHLNAASADKLGVAVFDVLNKFASLTSDTVFGAAATAWNSNVVAAEQYAVNNADNANIGTVVTDFVLTTGHDDVTGTAQDDNFVANLNANANTLQSGDAINGGDGYDELVATLAQTPFSITPTVKWVESISIQAQARASDSGDNNIRGEGVVNVDFGRVQGVKVIENTNSRADLIVEDVRILDSEKTKDITIVMRETDPGNVDYGVYFDQNSLRNVSSSTSQINLRVLDTYAVAQGKAPLLDSPYGSFTFYYSLDGAAPVKAVLASAAMQTAQTFAEMKVALQAAADQLFGANQVAVELGSTYSVPDSVTGQSVQGTELVLSAKAAITFDTTGTGSGWLATETVPAVSGLYTSFNTDTSKSTELVTSTIVLDDVGRGSTGGDLVVGGLSVGETSTSKGVGRFEITVEDNSKLRSIESTNNFLQEVTIKNGNTTRVDNAYNDNVKNSGNLTVNGDVAPQDFAGDNMLPGAVNHGNAFGFTDVRLIDGSAMTGKFEFTAGLTAAALGKYLNLVDTAAPAADNIAVAYSGGSNNDTISVNIDATVAASNSNINPGREDFTFAIQGNGGNDAITVAIGSLSGFNEDWYANQKLNNNVTIDGGAGNDTIRKPGAGDANIWGGAGNDVVYAENTGGMITWVLNAVDNDLADLRSSDNTSHELYKAKVEVTFEGITVSAAIASTNYKSSDLQINQAIKAAINGDAVLSKLLVAQDGPANSLVVKSLIDGEYTAADLGVAIKAPAAADLSAADVTAIATAWGGAAIPDAATAVTRMNADATATTAAGASYAAQEESLDADFDSFSVSDNIITGGDGNDVIVLGTSLGADAFTSSNDTVKFGAGFGSDTVVHFAAAGFGADTLDLTALGGKLSTTGASFSNGAGAAGLTAAISNNNGSIIIDDLVKKPAGGAAGTGNDSAANVKELFADDATAGTVLYVAVDSHNVGSVYQVVDGTGAADLTVTLVGTIDLAGTAWSTLTAANFA